MTEEKTSRNSHKRTYNRFGRFRGHGRWNPSTPNEKRNASKSNKHPPPDRRNHCRTANGLVLWINWFLQRQYDTHHRLSCLYHRNRNLPMTGEPIKPVKMPQKNSILFPAVVPTSTDEAHHGIANSLNLSEPLLLAATDTDAAFMSKLTLNIGITCGKFF